MRKKRILLVEDDDLVRRGLELALTSHGFTVHALSTAEEAMTEVRRLFFHGIICDLNLPGMSGLEFFAHVKSYTTRSSNILITACGFDDIVNNAKSAGIDTFFEKPFSIQALISGLNSAKKADGHMSQHRRGGWH